MRAGRPDYGGEAQARAPLDRRPSPGRFCERSRVARRGCPTWYHGPFGPTTFLSGRRRGDRVARSVRILKTKTVVNVAALELFIDEFRGDEMIDALIWMTEFAATHPDFAKKGNPGGRTYMAADEATSILMSFFSDEMAAPCDAEESTPVVEVNYQRGTIAFLARRYRVKLAPAIERATQEVPIRLLGKPAAGN